MSRTAIPSTAGDAIDAPGAIWGIQTQANARELRKAALYLARPCLYFVFSPAGLAPMRFMETPPAGSAGSGVEA